MLRLPQSMTNCVPIMKLEWSDDVGKKPGVGNDIGVLDRLEREDRDALRNGVAELEKGGSAEVAVLVEAHEEARPSNLGKHRVLQRPMVVDRVSIEQHELLARIDGAVAYGRENMDALALEDALERVHAGQVAAVAARDDGRNVPVDKRHHAPPF